MNSNFNLLNKTYKMIEYFDEILNNLPKKEYILKQKIEKALYESIECLFAYNINTMPRIKDKYLKDYLVKIAMLNFYSNIGYHKKAIAKRRFIVLGRKYAELTKMTYGLMKSKEEDYD